MKLHRFIGEYDLSKNEVEISTSETIRQIRAVLRLKTGDKILLSDGKGNDARATIDTISQRVITVKIEEKTTAPEPKRKVHLYLAILKKENFELAVQKAVEAGVSIITPVMTERTIKSGINVPRLEKIIREASEQCGRGTVPLLLPVSNYLEAMSHSDRAEEKIIFHLIDSPYTPDKNAKTASIFIGPEGGFTEKEIDLARERGYAPASLGPFTFRGETAAIVASYRAVEGI